MPPWEGRHLPAEEVTSRRALPFAAEARQAHSCCTSLFRNRNMRWLSVCTSDSRRPENGVPNGSWSWSSGPDVAKYRAGLGSEVTGREGGLNPGGNVHVRDTAWLHAPAPPPQPPSPRTPALTALTLRRKFDAVSRQPIALSHTFTNVEKR